MNPSKFNQDEQQAMKKCLIDAYNSGFDYIQAAEQLKEKHAMDLLEYEWKTVCIVLDNPENEL